MGIFTYLTREEMEKLPTKRLLAYKNKHLNHVPNFDEDVYTVNLIFWCRAREDAINILETREHIEPKPKKKRN